MRQSHIWQSSLQKEGLPVERIGSDCPAMLRKINAERSRVHSAIAGHRSAASAGFDQDAIAVFDAGREQAAKVVFE